MWPLLTFLIGAIFNLLKSKKDLLLQIFLYKKELEILKWQNQKILDEYINYYNSKRPHRGLDQRIPKKYKPHLCGKVQKLPILGGLHHHYFRGAA
jgi:hypothetical protein